MLSQTTGYAILALGFVATQPGPVLVRVIAEQTGIPRSYLAKILHILARKGILQTQRGIGGGVRLAKGVERMSFYDVAALLDDPVVAVRCIIDTVPCSEDRNCPCHVFWSKPWKREIALLKRKTIAHMARFLKRQTKQARTVRRRKSSGR